MVLCSGVTTFQGSCLFSNTNHEKDCKDFAAIKFLSVSFFVLSFNCELLTTTKISKIMVYDIKGTPGPFLVLYIISALFNLKDAKLALTMHATICMSVNLHSKNISVVSTNHKIKN